MNSLLSASKVTSNGAESVTLDCSNGVCITCGYPHVQPHLLATVSGKCLRMVGLGVMNQLGFRLRAFRFLEKIDETWVETRVPSV